tara:strand:+ start:1784 stop:1984 length:201 start_codon:yes stop_codon:yes gene_type:complete
MKTYWILQVNDNFHIIPAMNEEEIDRTYATVVNILPDEAWVAVIGGGWTYEIAKKELTILLANRKN